MRTRSLLVPVSFAVVAAASTAAAQTAASPAPQASASPAAEPSPKAPVSPQWPRASAVVAPAALGEDFHGGDASVLLQAVDEDTVSSKFREYRDVPQGVSIPDFRLFGEKSGLRYDVLGQGVRQADQHYRALIGQQWFRLALDYRRIPHRFGNEGTTLLAPTSEGVLEMSDTLQRTFQTALENQFKLNPSGVNYTFLNSLVTPSLEDGNVVDLALERQRGRVDLALTPGRDLDFRITYSRERRVGDRAAAGTSFGFGNVVETPEPVHYLTQDVLATASLERTWGSARAGLGYNRFDDRLQSESWDNPFRATDSTDSSASNAPNSSSVGGPSFGRFALPPSNEAVRGFVGATARLPGHTRLVADVTLSHWRQNDTAFIPYTSNTAITTPLRAFDASTLPASHLDGQINVLSQGYTLTSHPRPALTLTARFRDYNLDNNTPQISFPGYVRFDALWQATGRISVPYSDHSQRLDLTAGYDFGRVGLEGGYRYNRFHRTFRETDHTTENGFTAAATVRTSDWSSLRLSYERGSRRFDAYDYAHSEEASFVSPDSPTQLPELRRYDQANRDTDRLAALLQMSPGDKLTLSAAYRLDKDDYPDSAFGLINAKYTAFSADADYDASARWSLYAFYTLEKGKTFQHSRQSGSTPSTNPADDWTSQVDDDGDTIGAGTTVRIVPDRWILSLTARYQKIDGFNDLFSPPGGSPDTAFPIDNFDDTKLTTIGGELRYEARHGWRASVGGWWEEYRANDAQTQGTPLYVPGAMFLGANDGNYRGLVGYVRFARSW